MRGANEGNAAEEVARLIHALSVRQPWAWLIVQGYKDVENRDWPTSRRGTFAIHASKSATGQDRLDYEHVALQFPNISLPGFDEFDRGGIIGTARLVMCVTSCRSPWFRGRFGFMLADPQRCLFAPARGQPGFFPIERSLLRLAP